MYGQREKREREGRTTYLRSMKSRNYPWLENSVKTARDGDFFGGNPKSKVVMFPTQRAGAGESRSVHATGLSAAGRVRGPWTVQPAAGERRDEAMARLALAAPAMGLLGGVV